MAYSARNDTINTDPELGGCGVDQVPGCKRTSWQLSIHVDSFAIDFSRNYYCHLNIVATQVLSILGSISLQCDKNPDVAALAG